MLLWQGYCGISPIFSEQQQVAGKGVECWDQNQLSLAKVSLQPILVPFAYHKLPAKRELEAKQTPSELQIYQICASIQYLKTLISIYMYDNFYKNYIHVFVTVDLGSILAIFIQWAQRIRKGGYKGRREWFLYTLCLILREEEGSHLYIISYETMTTSLNGRRVSSDLQARNTPAVPILLKQKHTM